MKPVRIYNESHSDGLIFKAGQIECKQCKGQGWLYDTDPWLDFGGPARWRYKCECVKSKKR